jgi:hypothetical protein
VNPAVKFRFLRGGFEIVGDHPQASEARKVFDYYEDLVTELKLDAMIDGPTTVEAGEPFGVFVNLRHTREIERESGGFGRYLQNQNSGNMYYYNYGRPLENYRDKFTDAAKKALEEHFEVLSVTFQDDKVNSRAGREYGWRVTPYAYLLLKTRGPKVDRIPPLRLDLDFLDTSGYVILPVESASVPIVANAGGPIRPFGKLQLTQTLDERQAKDGQLILEVKAVAQGLVPAFDEILSLESPGFDVVRTEDQGLSVSKFDTEAAENVVVSERNWLVTLRALQDLKKLPKEFRFGTSLVDGAEVVYQRYDDADLAKTDAVVPLGARYGEVKANWILWLVGLGVLMAVTGAIAWRLRPRSTESAAEGLAIPKEVTPFTVLWFLREIQRNNGMAETSQRELAASIAGLERKYFAGSESEEPGELRGLAERWAARARGTRAHENGH